MHSCIHAGELSVTTGSSEFLRIQFRNSDHNKFILLHIIELSNLKGTC